MLEHMAFNGTAHFKPGELLVVFESAGARFGPHVNAYTSFDETVYMLQVPTDKPGLVDKGLSRARRLRGGHDPRSGRNRQGAGRRHRGVAAAARRKSPESFEKQAPVLYTSRGTRSGFPSARPRSSARSPPSRLRDFYETWYRPERMAVVVVGDIDAGGNGRRPSPSTFSGPGRQAAAPAPDPDRSVPPHAETLVNVAADPEGQAHRRSR